MATNTAGSLLLLLKAVPSFHTPSIYLHSTRVRGINIVADERKLVRSYILESMSQKSSTDFQFPVSVCASHVPSVCADIFSGSLTQVKSMEMRLLYVMATGHVKKLNR